MKGHDAEKRLGANSDTSANSDQVAWLATRCTKNVIIFFLPFTYFWSKLLAARRKHVTCSALAAQAVFLNTETSSLSSCQDNEVKAINISPSVLFVVLWIRDKVMCIRVLPFLGLAAVCYVCERQSK